MKLPTWFILGAGVVAGFDITLALLQIPIYFLQIRVAIWQPMVLSGVLLCVGLVLAVRYPKLRPDAGKFWATVTIVGFVIGFVYLPTVIWFSPAPSYYSQILSFNTSKVAVVATFISYGPMAAGNPIYPYAVSFVAWCPPWNVTGFALTIRGDNGSAVGWISLGPLGVRTPKCGSGEALTYFFSPIPNSSGSITFYSSGSMPIHALLSITGDGFDYFEVSAGASSSSGPASTVPIASTDTLYSFLALKALVVSIVVGATLTGWLPAIDSIERAWNRLKGR